MADEAQDTSQGDPGDETPQQPEVTEATEGQAPPERTWPVTVYKSTATHQAKDEADLQRLLGGGWSTEPPSSESES